MDKKVEVGEYRLYEKKGSAEFPVGSVIRYGGEWCIYRDIDNRHVFSKGNYQALFIDGVVIEHLEKEGRVKRVLFFNKDTSKIMTTRFENYLKAKEINMSGRKQRGVNILSFEINDFPGSLPRPTNKKITNLD